MMSEASGDDPCGGSRAGPPCLTDAMRGERRLDASNSGMGDAPWAFAAAIPTATVHLRASQLRRWARWKWPALA